MQAMGGTALLQRPCLSANRGSAARCPPSTSASSSWRAAGVAAGARSPNELVPKTTWKLCHRKQPKPCVFIVIACFLFGLPIKQGDLCLTLFLCEYVPTIGSAASATCTFLENLAGVLFSVLRFSGTVWSRVQQELASKSAGRNFGKGTLPWHLVSRGWAQGAPRGGPYMLRQRRRSRSSCGRHCAKPWMRRWRPTPPSASWVQAPKDQAFRGARQPPVFGAQQCSASGLL